MFIPSAVLLGALHGLEPGHSKTMTAAFIVAIRGTVGQAALLGVSAAASHTAVVWIVALVGLHYGAQLDNGRTEAHFQLASAALIISNDSALAHLGGLLGLPTLVLLSQQAPERYFSLIANHFTTPYQACVAGRWRSASS